ncbi:MAG: hypothetical protein ACOCUW_00235 [Gemmatimonadota bacterium]
MRPLAAAVLALAFIGPTLSCGDDGSAPTGPNEPGDGEQTYSHTLSVGASAQDLLAADDFTDLVVEVDYMTGYAPDPTALDRLETFLEARLYKASITIQDPTEIPAGGQDAYTLDEVRDLETDHRNTYTDGSTLAVYLLIVDGSFEQENVLGIAHYNTSTAFFGAAYDEASGGLGQPSRELTEATTFRHEFGHLLGLVAIDGSGTEMQAEHQDEENGHHCDNDRCLMYYAVESTDLFGSVFGDEIPALDRNCLDDLQANGGR